MIDNLTRPPPSFAGPYTPPYYLDCLDNTYLALANPYYSPNSTAQTDKTKPREEKTIGMAIANAFFSTFTLTRPRVSDSGFTALIQTAPIPAIRRGFVDSGLNLSTKRIMLRASVNSTSTVGPNSPKSDADDSVPVPMVLIDQDSDSDATIVQVSFGDRLGALIDTMKALKDLGLDVAKGTVTTESDVIETKFFITQLNTGRKVDDPDLLERIRLTIINNLLKYHPESSERLAMGEAFGIKAPEKKLDVDIATHIYVKDDGPKRSMLYLETSDRPGLLMEIIKIMADINVNVESAEIDTEGLAAKDKFHVSYRGAALNTSLSQVLVNCLRYYLRRPESDEDSY